MLSLPQEFIARRAPEKANFPHAFRFVGSIGRPADQVKQRRQFSSELLGYLASAVSIESVYRTNNHTRHKASIQPRQHNQYFLPVKLRYSPHPSSLSSIHGGKSPFVGPKKAARP